MSEDIELTEKRIRTHVAMPMGCLKSEVRDVTLKSMICAAVALLGVAATLAPAEPASADRSAPKVYKNGLPTEASYFPIGVWLQSPSNAPEYKAIGVNLFIGLYEGPTEGQLAELAERQMPVIAEQNDVALKSPNAGVVRGWIAADEPDNAQPLASGSWGSCIPANEVAKRSADIKAKDPTRPVLISFGRGVADPAWRGRGSCTGDMAYYDIAAAGADILSFDIYPVVSDTPAVAGRLDYPSRGVKRLRAAAREGQRVWAVIETTHIESKEARISPAQLRSEVWLALIEGANGIVYFAHEWTGGFREDGLFRYPEIVDAVRNTNAFVMQLAPVLNSPTIEGRLAVASAISTAAMLKEHDGTLYLFAGSTSAETGSASFSFGDFSSGRAEVIGENRNLTIANGAFHDRFDSPYQIHIYRIAEDARRQ